MVLAGRLGYESWRGGYLALMAGLLSGGFMFLPFLARGAGGGDVKAMFTAGTIAGIENLFEFMFITCVAGSVLGVGMLVMARFDRARWLHALHIIFNWRYDRENAANRLPPRQKEQLRIPFAIPIAIGVIAVISRKYLF